MNFQLVSALMRDVWLIPQDIAETYYHSLAYLLDGKQVDFEFPKFNPTFFTVDARSVEAGEMPDFNAAEPGVVAIIPVSGPLMKNDQMCGPVGMKSMGQMLEAADRSDNIKGIVLQIESPGGQAQGTSQLAEVVKNLKKPVVAYVDGMAASAAYWIASAADRIIAEPKSIIGSIGTMTSFADIQPALELQGVKFHKIVADQTPDKNAMTDKLRMGDYKQFKEEVLNPLAQDFIDSIKLNRPQIEAAQLTGKTFFAENVVGTMIDQVGSFTDSIKAIDEILESRNPKPETRNPKPETRNQKPETRNPKPIFSNNMKQYPNINQALGVELQTDDEGAHLNLDLLDSLESALQPTAKPAEPKPQPAKADPVADELEQMKQAFAAMQQRMDLMEGKPGSEPAKAIAKTDPGKQTEAGVVKDLSADNFLANLEAVSKEYLNR